MKCGVRSVECEDFASSLAEKKAACRGKDAVGTGWRRTIGHLCLGNFRRRLARVYVMMMSQCSSKWQVRYLQQPEAKPTKRSLSFGGSSPPRTAVDTGAWSN